MKRINIQGKGFLLLVILPLCFSVFLHSNQARSQTILLSATFEANAEGFAYSDDTFRGTSQPAYASGSYDPTGGFSGGGLRVGMGGIDAIRILGMSGGWSGDFVVIEDGMTSITLRYRFYFEKGYESDECGQALVSVDGVLVSPGGVDDFLEEFCGATPNLPAPQDSGWQQVSIDLNLTAGTHVITVGGYNSKKDAKFGEFMQVFFDDIEIVQEVTPPGQETNCTDGIDNDGDTFTDCADTDCAGAPNCNPEAICNDTVDNDGDGQTDCADTDCLSAPNCNPEAICNDTIDNDGDTFTDCADTDCAGAPNCNPEAICNDTVDNDGDGQTDCADTDCSSAPNCNPEAICNDTIDNDGDTFTDCADTDCAGAPNCNPEAICNDTIDNDGDTFTDCADTDCAGAPNCNPEAICNDTIDNDGDGQTDCADTDCASAPSCNQATIFSDDFNDGNANGWTVVNNAGASNWQVISGQYNQLNSNVGTFSQSFHRATYSRYANGFTLTNYELTVEVTPVSGASIGVMFRYQNDNNYYRFSISKNQGFSRLERRSNGSFATLASDGRGRTLNQPITIKIEVDGSKMLVYLDGEPLFSATDSNLTTGTVALFAQNIAVFDNVVIKEISSAPKVIVSGPTSYFVETTSTLKGSAVARNVPSGGGVKFVLDNGSSFTDFSAPYSGQFTNVSEGNHTVDAIIVNSSGQAISDPEGLDQDNNVSIGALGRYLVAMGDSITNGVGDDFPDDDESLSGRNLGRGFTPILEDLLSSGLNEPITIMNEGLGGTKSGSGAGHGISRLASTKLRHPGSQIWLILFGTNDSSGSLPVPSGMNCTEAQLQANNPSCVGTFKDNIRTIIKNLKSSGRQPLLAKVPFIINASLNRDQLIQEYNIVIDQLVVEHNLPVTPPDFYNYFMNNQDEFADDTHPNGNGYISISNCWYAALCQSGIIGISEPCPLDPCDLP